MMCLLIKQTDRNSTYQDKKSRKSYQQKQIQGQELTKSEKSRITDSGYDLKELEK